MISLLGFYILEMYNAALDFADLDFIIMTGGILLQQITFNGTYDVLKSIIVRLWSVMRGVRNNKHLIPFTIKIEKIPTQHGEKNILFKITGDLSKEQKTLVINRAFDTVQKISDGSFKLKEMTIANEAFN
jgi:hypothetical protein